MRKGLVRAATASALALAAVGVTAPPAHAATGTITTIAGGQGFGPARSVVQHVVALSVGPRETWVVVAYNSLEMYGLRRIDRTTGVESRPFFPFQQGSAAYSHAPSVVALPSGNALLAYNDRGGGFVVEVTPDGQSRRVAGGGAPSAGGRDGVPATSERLETISGLATSSRGAIFLTENTLVVSGRYADVEITSSRIRKIGTDGRITTVAGLLPPGDSGDGGPALAAQLEGPGSVATDPAGDVFVADNGRIRRISPLGVITTVVDRPAASLAWDSGSLYFVDQGRRQVRSWDGHAVHDVAGDGEFGRQTADGPALQASVVPVLLAARDGAVTFVQEHNRYVLVSTLHEVTPDGMMRRVAGSADGTEGGDGGPPLQAQFQIWSVPVADRQGNVYLVSHSRLRKLTPAGTLSSVAGTGYDFTDAGVDGPATAAVLNNLQGADVADDGTIYLATRTGIFHIDAAGMLRRVAGTGAGATAVPGPALQSPLFFPRGITVDATGAVWFAEECAIYRISASGLLSRVAGAVTCGHTDDGNPAATALLRQVWSLVLDSSGRVLFVESDPASQRSLLRRISATGQLETLAGAGTSTSDGAPAEETSLGQGFGIAIDPLDRVLVSVSSGLIRRIDEDGRVRTIAGGGASHADGPALDAVLGLPSSPAVDGSGNVYVACLDTGSPFGGTVIRRLTAA